MAKEGKIEVILPSKFAGGGFRLKTSDGTWYSSRERHEGELEAGYTIRFNTERQGKDEFVTKFKVIEKGQPTPYAGSKGKGGGGFRAPADPAAKAAQEARYAAQAVREAQKHEHQLMVIEPRIVWSDCRSKAIELVDLYIRHGAVALGAENASKRKGIIDAAVAASTQAFFEETITKFGSKASKAPKAAAPAATPDDDLGDDALGDPDDDLGDDDLDDDL